MDTARVGLVIRALRRRKRWRQIDLARTAGVSQSLVSLIERGHGDRLTTEVLRRVAVAVDGRLVVDVRWRAGDLDRLLDAGHARLVDTTAMRLRSLGWDVRIEVTYNDVSARSSGSMDILAWHPPSESLLVIEIKTEVPSVEATVRKLDEKARVAAAVAVRRFGWRSVKVSRLLVLEASSTNRRRIDAHRSLFDSALPDRDDAVRAWLRHPSSTIDGRIFVATNNVGAGIRNLGGRHRVRVVKQVRGRQELRTNRGRSRTAALDREREITILRG